MEREIRKFYAVWSPCVLGFCCLLLGEGSEAERSTVEAFESYLSRGLDLDLGQLPTLLLLFALDAAKRTTVAPPPAVPKTHKLQEAVALLPWRERAVFALRGSVGLDEMAISEVVEIPIQEVRRSWMKALFRLRELLPSDFFRGRKP